MLINSEQIEAIEATEKNSLKMTGVPKEGRIAYFMRWVADQWNK